MRFSLPSPEFGLHVLMVLAVVVLVTSFVPQVAGLKKYIGLV